jgi:hypothetical protein
MIRPRAIRAPSTMPARAAFETRPFLDRPGPGERVGDGVGRVEGESVIGFANVAVVRMMTGLAKTAGIYPETLALVVEIPTPALQAKAVYMFVGKALEQSVCPVVLPSCEKPFGQQAAAVDQLKAVS